jgi:hypothetical protein
MLGSARRGILALALAALCALGAPAPAHAGAQVFFTDIQIPAGGDAKARKSRTKAVRKLLANAAKRADFGKAAEVRITAAVTELESIEGDDVVKVRCTMTGRLKGGPLARSRLEFSGKPSQRRELEKKVLGMVADGLVTRLAQMARERAAKDPPAAPR